MTVIEKNPSPNTTGTPNNLQPQVTTLGSPVNGNPLAGMMGGGNDANPLAKHFQHLDTVPKGKYGAKIVDFTLGTNNFGELRSTMSFKFQEGELAGMVYEDSRRVTEKSFRFLKRDLQVVSGQTLAEANEVYDHINNCAGPVRDRIVGAVVEIVVVHREWKDRTYVNIDSMKLLQPAPNGTDRNKLE